MIQNGLQQEVKTVSFDSESPEFVHARFSDIMSRLSSELVPVPASESSPEPSPEPAPEPSPEPAQ